MRITTGKVFSDPYIIQTPFLGILTGSSGWVKFLIIFSKISFRAGKTSWIERLIQDSKLSSRPKIIRYHYPEQLNKSPVKWCEKFENIQVEYEQGIPKNADYWTNIDKNTLGRRWFLVFLKAQTLSKILGILKSPKIVQNFGYF